MLETSARLLQLLALLPERRAWTGAELVARLEVTPRTLRRDVDRLRRLGYPIESTSGPAGGYALAAGRAVPPLSFEPGEVVAVALGLSLVGLEAGTRSVREAAESAVSKVEQVLPTRLRDRLRRLRAAVHGSGARAALDPVAELAAACADRRVARFVYARADGVESDREVEPHGVTLSGGRWYLVAHDRGRGDWRTFRVDRVASPITLGGGFVPRQAPADDLGEWVVAGHAAHRWPLEGRVVYAVPAEALRARVPERYATVEAIDPDTSRLVVTGSSWESMAAWLAVLGAPLAVEGPEALRDAVTALAAQLEAATRRGVV